MSIVKSLRGQLAPIHPEGYMFVAGFAVATLILWWLWAPLGWLGLIVTLWCAYFFRDPTRVTPASAWRPCSGCRSSCRFSIAT
jgi:phosphatidylserine decarboxylase